MVQPIVIKLLWLSLVSCKARLKLVSVTGYLALLAAGYSMVNGSVIPLSLKASTLEARGWVCLCLVATVEAGSTTSWGALIATAVASHMLLFATFHVETILPCVAG